MKAHASQGDFFVECRTWLGVLTLVALGACSKPAPAPSLQLTRYTLDDGTAYVEEIGGKREGLSVTVLKGKASLVATYQNDKAEGPVLAFDDEGRPREMTTFHKGQLDGEWRCWNQAGEKIQWGQFQKNEMHGSWTVNAAVSVYDKGKLVSGRSIAFDSLCGRSSVDELSGQ